MTQRGIVSGKLLVLVLLLCVVSGCATVQPFGPAPRVETAQPLTQVPDEYAFYTPPADRSFYPILPDGEVKNVILLIGDGMGLAQVASARIKAVGADGCLHVDRLPVTGFATTHSTSLVTDSAAAGTALATGCKTRNGTLALLPDQSRLKTILEAARDKKMATGLVVVCTPNHATPAAFASHVQSRTMGPEITEQMLENKVDVIFARGDAGTTTQPSPDASQAIQAGYQVVSNRDQMGTVIADQTPVLGLFRDASGQNPPMLAAMTAKAIEILNKDQDGFFLMVEGSDIDGACHGNNASGSIQKTLLFDLAIKEAIEFALKDKHTLVVVTADHETGGMAVNGGSLDGNEVNVGWTTGGHTAIPVPVYAFGPGASRFMGLRDNTEIPRVFAQLLGIDDFPKAFPREQLYKHKLTTQLTSPNFSPPVVRSDSLSGSEQWIEYAWPTPQTVHRLVCAWPSNDLPAQYKIEWHDGTAWQPCSGTDDWRTPAADTEDYTIDPVQTSRLRMVMRTKTGKPAKHAQFDAYHIPRLTPPVVEAQEDWSKDFAPSADGFIRDWLVCGPFPSPGLREEIKDKPINWDQDMLDNCWIYGAGRGEAVIQPRVDHEHVAFFPAGTLALWKPMDVRVAWQPVHADGDRLDLKDRFLNNMIVKSGQVVEQCFGYACAYLDVPHDLDASLAVGSDDGYKIWIDDQLVADLVVFRGAAVDQEKHPVKLTKGRHRLLVKVHNDIAGHDLFLRFLDADDKPITDYVVRLTP